MTHLPMRRFRSPDDTRLLLRLAVTLGVLAVVAVGLGTYSFVSSILQDRQNTRELASAKRELADAMQGLARAERALTDTFISRRQGVLAACTEREALKDDLRKILLRFDVKPEDLPRRRDGARALDPVDGGCEAYTQRLLPKESAP